MYLKQSTIGYRQDVFPFLKVAQDYGYDLAAIFDSLGFSEFLTIVRDPSAKIIPVVPLRYLIQYMESKGEQRFTIDAALSYGLRVIEKSILKCEQEAANLFECLTIFTRAISQHISNQQFYVLEKTHGGYFFKRNHFNAIEVGASGMELYILSVVCLMTQQYLKAPWQPEIIWLTDTNKADAFAEVFNPQHIFYNKPYSAVFFSDTVLNSPNPSSQFQGKMTPLTGVDLAKLSFSDVVKNAILPFANNSRPTIKQVASYLGVNLRTLQRRLSVENSSFKQINAELTFNQAQSLLLESKFSIIDIAHELNYQNPTHFIRAFKQRYGQTPKQFRDSTVNNL